MDSAATRQYRNSPMPDPFPGSSSRSAPAATETLPLSRPPHSPMQHTHTGLLSPAPIKHTPQSSSGASFGTQPQSLSGSSGQSTNFHLTLPGTSRSPNFFHHYSGVNTPLSLIRGFPEMSGTAPGGLSPNPQASYIHSSGGSNSHTDATFKLDGATSPLPFVNAPEGVATMGLTPFTSGAEATALPQVSPPLTHAPHPLNDRLAKA